MAKSKASTQGAARRARAAMNGAACGCPPKVGQPGGRARDEVGPGAHAAGVDAAMKAANLKHLRRIEGQVRGIAAMVEEDRYCADIIQQAAAVQESLRSVAKNLFRNHLKHCAAAAFHEPAGVSDDMIEELVELSGRLTR